jgi:CRISPR type III-A-associated RAMP protein Csm4
MQQALLIRLRPLGPWRYGPADGSHERTDTLYRSDRLFSAVTLAMHQLGLLDEWLDATARAETPAVVFSSLFPFQGDTLFAIPPSTLWPPPANLVTSPSPVFLTKTRWSAAQFVPLTAIDSLLTGQPLLADQWFPDPESACLLRRDRPSSSPFRAMARSSAAVDRLTKTGGEVKSLAGVEFEAGAGLWTVARFQDAAAEYTWSPRVQGAFRLLADSGFGGGRSKGWGQTQAPEFQKGAWPGLLLPKTGRAQRNGSNGDTPAASLYWLLSLYSPSAADTVDWSGGDYRLVLRSGRVESSAASGALKKQARMISEGAVLSAGAEPFGVAVDVAPEGFAHPVYRSGLALALLFPPPRVAEKDKPVEEPVTEEETVEPLVAEPAVEDKAADNNAKKVKEEEAEQVSETSEQAEVPAKPISAEESSASATVEDDAEAEILEDANEPAEMADTAEQEEVVTHQEPSMGDPAEPVHAEEPSEPTPVEEPAEPETIEDPKEPEPPLEEPPQEPGREPNEPEPPPQQEHDHEI